MELRPERHADAMRLRKQWRVWNCALRVGDIRENLDLLQGMKTFVAVRTLYYLRDDAPAVMAFAATAGVRRVVLSGNSNRARQSVEHPESELGRFNRLGVGRGHERGTDGRGLYGRDRGRGGRSDRGRGAVTDAIRVSPFAVTHKLSCDLDETEAKDWPDKRYAPLEGTIKHRRSSSAMSRGGAGKRRRSLPRSIRGVSRRVVRSAAARRSKNWPRSITRTTTRSTRTCGRHGWREEIDGGPTYFPALIGPGGALVIGNQGNHRLAMAKALKLATVLIQVRGELKEVNAAFEPVTFRPQLHEGAREIPAMTTPAERLAYYELAVKAAPVGTVVELGTWLGAATVFLAAGLRDAGVKSRLHAYDRFRGSRSTSTRRGSRWQQSRCTTSSATT